MLRKGPQRRHGKGQLPLITSRCTGDSLRIVFSNEPVRGRGEMENAEHLQVTAARVVGQEQGP